MYLFNKYETNIHFEKYDTHLKRNWNPNQFSTSYLYGYKLKKKTLKPKSDPQKYKADISIQIFLKRNLEPKQKITIFWVNLYLYLVHIEKDTKI